MLSFEKSPLLFLFESHVRLIYTTMVLDADKECDTVLLDALHPDMGNSHLVPGTKALFFGKVKGIDTAFRATILGQKAASTERAVLLTFPFETYYFQRRSFLRVPLSIDLPSVCLRKTNGLMGEVRPVDLGGGGIRVLLPEKKPNGDINEIFDVGDLVLIERIAFEGFLLPPLTGTVVHREHAGRDAGGDLQGLGIAFVDFPSAYEEPLLSYISKKDREMLKNLRFEPGK
jgi:c-di-GMP-binding flagellar brake protein YcgR